MDESGDHGLVRVNPHFPVFLLCGVLIEHSDYDWTRNAMNKLKKDIWRTEEVIFHSRDIRKCEKEFVTLFDLDVKREFIQRLNSIMTESNYTVIASAINKERYIQRYGRLSGDVYELSLSFIIERAVFFLDALGSAPIKLNILIEKRGKKEDRQLDAHFNRLLSRGTNYVSGDRLRAYQMNIRFISKKENINGLQIADLIAYPIARNVINPERANPAFDQIVSKIYTKKGQRYGLKVFP